MEKALLPALECILPHRQMFVVRQCCCIHRHYQADLDADLGIKLGTVEGITSSISNISFSVGKNSRSGRTTSSIISVFMSPVGIGMLKSSCISFC